MAAILPITPTLLSTFLTCPRQYKAKYITKEVVFTANEATLFGRRLHESVENTLKHQAALTPEAAFMQPYVNWCFKKAAQPGVEMLVETRLAITGAYEPCEWGGWPANGSTVGRKVWQRLQVDVLFIDHTNKMNIIVDWKTGKPRPDHTQKDIACICATRKTGYTKNVCMWMHVKHGEQIVEAVDLVSLKPVEAHLENIKRYEAACLADNFEPTKNGLCGQWCDVIACPHNGKNR